MGLFGFSRTGTVSGDEDPNLNYTRADGGNVSTVLPMVQRTKAERAGVVPTVHATLIPNPTASAPAAVALAAPERVVVVAAMTDATPPAPGPTTTNHPRRPQPQPKPTRGNPLSCEPNEWDDLRVTLGRHPTNMAQCPCCNRINARTRVTTYPSLLSWLFAIGVFVLCWPMQYLPGIMVIFAGLPFVWDKLKRSDHYCSKCDKRVGSVQPFSDCGVRHLA